MTKLKDYGIKFWNEETDHEICAIFQAKNYFDAAIIVKPIQVDGYIKGQPAYIEDRDKSCYTVPLAVLIKQGEMAEPKADGQKTYVASLVAFRETKFNHCVAMLQAASQDEATGKAYTTGCVEYPPDEGYFNHSQSVVPLSDLEIAAGIKP